MKNQITRRNLLAAAGAMVGAGMAEQVSPAAPRPKRTAFRYSLNMATISGQHLSLVDEIETAARAGYDAIEPWMDKVNQYAAGGGSLKDLGQHIRDRGLTVESAIGFSEWIVDDDARRARGLVEFRLAMDKLAQMGGKRIAAPPVGATDHTETDWLKIAARYRALLELGDQMGIVPQVEIWGFSKTLNRLGSAAQVAIETGHPNACILPDVFHLYKGGSDFTGLRLLSHNAIHVLHLNDYPATPPRETITDADRVYPGDGVAPLPLLYRNLRDIGYTGVLSIELFNQSYWKQDALTVARTALEKAKGVEGRGG